MIRRNRKHTAGSNLKFISSYIPEVLFNRLDDYARTDGRSRSAAIEQLLNQALNEKSDTRRRAVPA
jgi:metal-responsive CopG/Arc/MetJ family transcriptional regulator